MVDRVIYHPLFRTDVVEAARWYDDKCVGLGDALVLNVQLAVDAIIQDPERFAVNANGLRHRRIKRFPYIVLFEVEENVVEFWGVLHTARSVAKWKRSR